MAGKIIRDLLIRIRDFYLVHVIWRHYKIGRNFHAGRGVNLWAPTGITIGDNVYIGRYSQIECDAEIGNDVIFGNYVALVGRYDHDFRAPGVPIRQAASVRNSGLEKKEQELRVIVEDDVWIGYGAIILSGVVVKRGCIIGAGAIVTKDTEEFGIYCGVPATRIGERFRTSADRDKHIREYFKE